MTVQRTRASVIVRNPKTDVGNFLKEFAKETEHTVQFQNF
jgi:hypothetical protein